MLRVVVWGVPNPDVPDDELDEAIVFDNVSYVSLLNDGTHGPPPIIAPTKNGPAARAKVGEKVLYINLSHVPLFEIERTAAD